MRIWETKPGKGLVAVRSPRTLLISIYNNEKKQYRRPENDIYKLDMNLTEKNQALKTMEIKREFKRDDGA